MGQPGGIAVHTILLASSDLDLSHPPSTFRGINTKKLDEFCNLSSYLLYERLIGKSCRLVSTLATAPVTAASARAFATVKSEAALDRDRAQFFCPLFYFGGLFAHAMGRVLLPGCRSDEGNRIGPTFRALKAFITSRSVGVFINRGFSSSRNVARRAMASLNWVSYWR